MPDTLPESWSCTRPSGHVFRARVVRHEFSSERAGVLRDNFALQDFNNLQPGDEVICYTVENRPATTEEVVQQQAVEVGR